MLLAALVYSLLAMKVRICAGVSLCGICGSFFVQAGVWGVALRLDGEIRREGKVWRPVLRRRYAPAGPMKGGQSKRLNALRSYLPAVLRVGEFERFAAHVRLGLGDACATAMTAGGVRAAGAALLACAGLPCALSVEPDYRTPCFFLSADSIFCVRPGDIVFAVIKAAAERRGKRDSNGKASH